MSAEGDYYVIIHRMSYSSQILILIPKEGLCKVSVIHRPMADAGVGLITLLPHSRAYFVYAIDEAKIYKALHLW